MFRNFLYDEDAASSVEYACLICLLLIIMLVAVVTTGQQAMSTFTTTGNAIGSASS
jgi:Flp pilus assembly pilin Flp